MLRFLIRRLGRRVPTVLAVALLIFVLFSVIPGSFASSSATTAAARRTPR